MKIAAVSDDGMTISQHFGRAAFYVGVTVQDNQILVRERCEKMGHAQFGGEMHADGNDPRGHGFDPASQLRQARMATAIADCEVLLAQVLVANAGCETTTVQMELLKQTLTECFGIQHTPIQFETANCGQGTVMCQNREA